MAINKTVYRHIRLDRNECFYVGMGNKLRPYSEKRNNIWHKITKKTDYIVEVIGEMPLELAEELEEFMIECYGRICLKTGPLANIDSGGYNPTKNKTRGKNISKALKGRKFSKNHKKNLSNAKKNKIGRSTKVKNIKTNKVFPSISKAAKSIRMKPSTLSAMLRGQNPNKTNMRWL